MKMGGGEMGHNGEEEAEVTGKESTECVWQGDIFFKSDRQLKVPSKMCAALKRHSSAHLWR